MTTAVFTVSESELAAAHVLAFRAKAWPVWVRWVGLAMAAVAILDVAYRLSRDASVPTLNEARLFVIGLLCAALAEYHRRWGVERSVRRAFRSIKDAEGPMTAVWSGDRLRLGDDYTSQTYPWPELVGWGESPEVLVVWMKDRTVLTFPRRSLDPAVLLDLKSHLPKAAKR